MCLYGSALCQRSRPRRSILCQATRFLFVPTRTSRLFRNNESFVRLLHTNRCGMPYHKIPYVVKRCIRNLPFFAKIVYVLFRLFQSPSFPKKGEIVVLVGNILKIGNRGRRFYVDRMTQVFARKADINMFVDTGQVRIQDSLS